MGYYGLFRKQMVIFLVVTVISVTLGVLGPGVLGLITTRIFTGVMAMTDGQATELDFPYMAQVAAVLLCMYAAMYACQYLQGRMMTRITNRTTYNIRKDISRKINRLPLSWFDESAHGEVLSLVTNDADVLGVTLGQVTTQLFNSAFTLVGVGGTMLVMDPQLGLLVLCLVPLGWAVSKILSIRSGRHYQAHQEHISELTSFSDKHYSAHSMVQATGSTARSQAIFEEASGRMRRDAFRAQSIAGVFLPVMSAATNFCYAGVCALGGRLVLQGTMTIGNLQAFIQYIRSFFNALVQLATIRTSLEHLVAAAGHIFDFLEMPEEASWEGERKPDDVEGGVRVQELGYTYGKADRPAVREVSFEARPGERVVLAGPSGGGKSTLLRLMGGFLPAGEGGVRLDGVPLGKYVQDTLTAFIGSVPQIPWLVNETVEDNIRYGRPDATEEQVVEAAKAAQADGFIRALPEGYKTPVAEMAANLSSGQKQLVQLARAFLGHPSVLLLDDALVELDALTRQEILTALRETGATQILASSLPDVAASADRLIMLEDGRIVQEGTPEELFTQPGAFRSYMEGNDAQSETGS